MRRGFWKLRRRQIAEFPLGLARDYGANFRRLHLESCTPERKQANWNVLVCTGTYQSVPVPASTRIPRLVQASTRWYKAVPDFLVWNKTVPTSTRIPRFVQDGTRRYQQVQDMVGLVQDSTSKYKISQIGTRLYKMVQGSTRIPRKVQDGMLHDSTSSSLIHGQTAQAWLAPPKFPQPLVDLIHVAPTPAICSS